MRCLVSHHRIVWRQSQSQLRTPASRKRMCRHVRRRKTSRPGDEQARPARRRNLGRFPSDKSGWPRLAPRRSAQVSRPAATNGTGQRRPSSIRRCKRTGRRSSGNSMPRPKRRPCLLSSCRRSKAFLRCGILAHGFVLARCRDCGWCRPVAFSCRRRGFCPSCIGRRMSDFAAHLVDRVLPRCPLRQWVLTVPLSLAREDDVRSRADHRRLAPAYRSGLVVASTARAAARHQGCAQDRGGDGNSAIQLGARARARTSILCFLTGFTAFPSAGRRYSIRRPDRPTRTSRAWPRRYSDESRAGSPWRAEPGPPGFRRCSAASRGNIPGGGRRSQRHRPASRSTRRPRPRRARGPRRRRARSPLRRGRRVQPPGRYPSGRE